jgi:hypothetical protein
MTSLIRSVVVAVVAVVVAASVSGCWPSKGKVPDSVMSAIPTAAAHGAKLICGMDKGALEVATGYAVGRTEGQLRMVDGVGTGKCSVWAKDESMINGSLMAVTMLAASSPDGVTERSNLLGKGVRAPDLTYTTVDGGIWGAVKADPGHMALGAVSSVFYGATVIKVLTRSAGVGRDPAADQLALTQQVAATYGLVGSGGAS